MCMMKRKFPFFIIALFIICPSCSKRVPIHLDNIAFSKQNFTFCFKGKDSTQLTYIIKYGNFELYKTQFFAEDDSSYSFKKATIKMLSKKAYEIAYEIANKDSFPIHYMIKNDSIILCDTAIFYKKIPPVISDSIYAYMKNTHYAGVQKSTYKDKIYDVKKFLVNYNLKADSTTIETMARYLFYLLTNNTIAYKNNKKIPIYKQLPAQSVNIKTNMNADYFYLVGVKNQKTLDDFIKTEIVNGFTQGQSSYVRGTKDLHLSPIKTHGNYLYLFLCGINKDWSSKSILVGGVIIDDVPPYISSKFNYSSIFEAKKHREYGYNIEKFYNYYVDFDYNYDIQTDILSLKYGNFDGNDYDGYSVPFILKLDSSFDLSAIVIKGKKKKINDMNVEIREQGNTIYNYTKHYIIRFRHHFHKLNTGDNYIQVDFLDTRGNKSTTTINIRTERIRNNGTEVNVYNEIYN